MQENLETEDKKCVRCDGPVSKNYELCKPCSISERALSTMSAVAGKHPNIVLLNTPSSSSELIDGKCLKHNITFSTCLTDMKHHKNVCPDCISRIKSRIEVLDMMNPNLKLIDVNEYYSWSDEVMVECYLHGSTSKRIDLLCTGAGCKKCAMEKIHYAASTKIDDFIIQANLKHNNKFKYIINPVDFYNKKIIDVICPSHGVTTQKFKNHLHSTYGCRMCYNEQPKNSHHPEDVYKDRETTLYYIQITYNNQLFYKIGLTLRDVTHRFKCEAGLSYEIIHEEVFRDGSLAHRIESHVKEQCSKYKYIIYDDFRILHSGGNHEIFNVDISTCVFSTIKQFKENIK